MITKSKRAFALSEILIFAFLVYTGLVKVVEVAPIGPENTEVGFASLNGAIAKIFPFNNMWYELTEWLGYIAIGVCLGFAFLGLLQIIKGKSLKAVDKELWVLAGFYVVVIGCYVLFEIVELNYRPVILDEGLEASYPSSHTMLAVCVFGAAVYEFDKYINNKTLNAVLKCLCILAAALMVVGRMLSGVHWFTDICGGVLLSVTLLSLFRAVNLRLEEK